MRYDESESVFQHTQIERIGEVVSRTSRPWTAKIHSLLRHLEKEGFTGAPRVVGSGFDQGGSETVTYLEGEIMHPGQPTVEGAAAVGELLAQLHAATRSFVTVPDAVWQPVFHRELGDSSKVIGHGDTAPWNIVTRNGLPFALIDWDMAGPIDPCVELAQACWLNANLYSDDIPEKDRLPPLVERAHQLRAIVDAYGLPREKRHTLFDRIVEFAAYSMANDTYEANVTPVTRASEALWSLTWKARSIQWLLRNARTLRNALV